MVEETGIAEFTLLLFREEITTFNLFHLLQMSIHCFLASIRVADIDRDTKGKGMIRNDTLERKGGVRVQDKEVEEL